MGAGLQGHVGRGAARRAPAAAAHVPRHARSPWRWWKPSPTTSSPSASTQPTIGFGRVVQAPRSARRRARAMWAWSTAEKPRGHEARTRVSVCGQWARWPRRRAAAAADRRGPASRAPAVSSSSRKSARPRSCDRPRRSARSHLVELAQLAHHELPDPARGNSRSAPSAPRAPPRAPRPRSALPTPALLQRTVEAGAQLALVEALAPPITLDHHRQLDLDGFQREKRSPQASHSRRRRIVAPSSLTRESITRVSSCWQNGQCMQASAEWKSAVDREGLTLRRDRGTRTFASTVSSFGRVEHVADPVRQATHSFSL
jgi:hypothetical protein